MEQVGFAHADGDDLDWDPELDGQATSSSYKGSSEDVKGNGNELENDISETDRLEKSRDVRMPSFPSSSLSPSKEHRSLKRKAEDSGARTILFKRVKGAINNDYRQLLNIDIQDAVTQSIHPDYDRLPSTLIGSTFWSSFEKASFFSALCRLGKANISGIASRIKTKSVMEVQEYLSLLQQGMVEKHLDEPRQQFLGLIDLPAASQISQECCEALERAADALSLRQEQYEERVERMKWKDSWLLTRNVKKRVDDHISPKGGDITVESIFSATELLNLPTWLELSRLVFMNPTSPYEDENWRYFAEEGEEPSIRATAFDDFQSLAVIVTKKLVSTTIFCAQCRLRAMDPRSFSRRELVKSIDVEAAVKTLGLETNSWDFWRDCPRRCHLEVYDDSSPNPYPSYEEIETFLENDESRPAPQSFEKTVVSSDDGGEGNDNDYGGDDSFLETPENSPELVTTFCSDTDLEPAALKETERQTRNLASTYLEDRGLDLEGPIDPFDSEFQNPNSQRQQILKKIQDKSAAESKQYEYAEMFDVKASLTEEQRLWDILKLKPPFTIKPEDVDLPPNPKQNRKEGFELEDWRDKLKYLSPWETITKRSATGVVD